MGLTLLLILLSLVVFWAGFRAPPHALQHQSRAGFFVLIALAGISGLFAYREASALATLRAVIEPVPEVTALTYVPTRGEALAITRFLQSMPPSGRTRSYHADPQSMIEQAEERNTEYWILDTALAPDSVLSFYRSAGPRMGWTMEADSGSFLVMARDSTRLVLFVGDRSPPSGSQVLYAVSWDPGNKDFRDP